jgi:hypothetical protein
MQVIPPNFVNVRLQEDDRQLYAKVHEAAEKQTGQRLNMADLYRLAIGNLAKQLNVKGAK